MQKVTFDPNAPIAAKRRGQLRKQQQQEQPSESEKDTTSSVQNSPKRRAQQKRQQQKEEEEEKEEEKQPVITEPPSASEPAPPPPVEEEEEEDPVVQKWFDELTRIVEQASVPIITFVGMVQAKLHLEDERLLFKYGKRVLVHKGKTPQEFVKLNSHLGTSLLRVFLMQVDENESLAKAECSHLDDILGLEERFPKEDTYLGVNSSQARGAMDELLGQERMIEAIFAPAWAYQLVGDSFFQALLSTHCLGAMEAAYSSLISSVPACKSFTLKELICSKEVRHNFAFMTAYHYVSLGEVSTKRPRNDHYVNALAMRQSVRLELLVCQTWFEQARAVPNSLLKEWDERVAEKAQQKGVAWKNRMDIYRAMLPQREIIRRN